MNSYFPILFGTDRFMIDVQETFNKLERHKTKGVDILPPFLTIDRLFLNTSYLTTW